MEFPRIGKNLEGVEKPKAANDNRQRFDDLMKTLVHPDSLITPEMIQEVKLNTEPNYPTDSPFYKRKTALHKLLLELCWSTGTTPSSDDLYNDIVFNLRMLNAPKSSTEE